MDNSRAVPTVQTRHEYERSAIQRCCRRFQTRWSSSRSSEEQSNRERGIYAEIASKIKRRPTYLPHPDLRCCCTTIDQADGIEIPCNNQAPGVEETLQPGTTNNHDEPGSSSSQAKDKKKRNPVVIHDHITVIPGQPTMYQCNVCVKQFKTKAHIKYHEFCLDGEKPFKCGECGQGFIAKSHYEYHLRTHTGERPYLCRICGKGFNQQGKVTRHMRCHTGEKPFVCDECGRGFATAQALRSHHLIHTGERPFACKYCSKRFTGMTNLKKHLITHTGERSFLCNVCGKSFGLKWTLDLHSRTHSSERPYACDQCDRAFSNNKDLKRHRVVHSGERPFECWFCETGFKRKDNLSRHIHYTHNQPKEVAKQLANEAAEKYLAIGQSNSKGSTSTSQKRNVDESGPPLKKRRLTPKAIGVQIDERMSDRRDVSTPPGVTPTPPTQVIDDCSTLAISLSSPAVSPEIHPPSTPDSSPLRLPMTIDDYHYDHEVPLPTPPLPNQSPVQVPNEYALLAIVFFVLPCIFYFNKLF